MKTVSYTFSAAATAAALAFSGCASQKHEAVPPPTPVHPVTAVVREVQPIRVLSGLIAPLQNVAITNSLQEPTAYVFVNEGDTVRRGQTLATLDTSDLQASLVSAERTAAEAQAHVDQVRYQATLALQQGGEQVRAAQAGLSQAQENLRLAQLTLTRDEALLGQGYISQQAVDQQRSQMQVDQQAVQSAQATLAQAQQNEQANGTQSRGMQQANVAQAVAAAASARAQAANIQAQIVKGNIVSPIAGVVVNRNLNPGEYPGTRQIFTLQQVNHVYAELNAYGTQVAGIKAAASATVTSPSVSRRTFAGSVVAVLSPTSPSSSGFIVKVEIANPDTALRPGMAVTGKIIESSVKGIAIPTSAFIDDTHQTVMTISGDVAHVTNVNETVEDQQWAIVTGIPIGTKVVADGQAGLTDGQKVAVR